MTLANASKVLKDIQSFDLSEWDVSFWLVKRKLRDKKAQYSVLRVNVDGRLEKRLVGYVKNQLQDKRFHIEAYDYANGDGDDTLFEMDASATDFLTIKEAIGAGFENARVTKYDELLSSWAYIVCLEKGDNRLFAWRKINSMTQPKKAESRKATFFRDEQLIDIDDKQVFLIDPRFDFFVLEDMMFIANKKEFESSMNFREGMEKNQKRLLMIFYRVVSSSM